MENKLLVNALKIMNDRGYVSGIRIINPLDNKRFEVLNQIMLQNPINDPSNYFNLVINEYSRASLNSQVELYINFILNSLDF